MDTDEYMDDSVLQAFDKMYLRILQNLLQVFSISNEVAEYHQHDSVQAQMILVIFGLNDAQYADAFQ